MGTDKSFDLKVGDWWVDGFGCEVDKGTGALLFDKEVFGEFEGEVFFLDDVELSDGKAVTGYVVVLVNELSC